MSDPITSLADILGRHPAEQSALLPILHDVQAEHGHIGEQAVRGIATALNLTAAEVHGVVSFYSDFCTAAAQLPVLRLCVAEACQARGCASVQAAAESCAAGKVDIEPVYCLGLCSVGPAALLRGRVHARLDADGIAALIRDVP